MSRKQVHPPPPAPASSLSTRPHAAPSWSLAERRGYAVLAVLGVGLRLWRYVLDRSLWLDEAWLANNISTRSFAGLLDPLTDDQEAPVGYLALVKLLTFFLGEGERVWRLVALIAGIATLPLFLRVGRGWLRPRALLVAFALLALSPPLIHYACETKPYASDVFVTTLLLFCWRRYEERGRSLDVALGFAVVGAVAVWFAYPAVFVLGGLGTYSAYRAWRAQGPGAALRALAPAGVWLLSFGVLFAVALRTRMEAAGLKDYWAAAFMPFPPTSIEDLRWYPRAFFGLFRDVGGVELRGLAGALFVLGLLAARKDRAPLVAAACLPLGLALAASGVGVYPFEGRLALWSAPLLLLPLAAGTELLCRRLEPAVRGASAVVIGALFLYTLRDNLLELAHGTRPQGLAPMLARIEAERGPGDELFFGYGVAPVFEYYAAPRFPSLLSMRRTVAHEPGRDLLAGFVEDALTLRGRVWVLFEHIWTDRSSTLDDDYLDVLRRFGVPLASYRAVEASAHLFDFGTPVDVRTAAAE